MPAAPVFEGEARPVRAHAVLPQELLEAPLQLGFPHLPLVGRRLAAEAVAVVDTGLVEARHGAHRPRKPRAPRYRRATAISRQKKRAPRRAGGNTPPASDWPARGAPPPIGPRRPPAPPPARSDWPRVPGEVLAREAGGEERGKAKWRTGGTIGPAGGGRDG